MKKTIFSLLLATCVCSFNGFSLEKQDVLACATRMFSKPNSAFMHKIVPAKKGVKVFVDSLPIGLKWNERRQLIEGIAPKEGFYTYYIYVPNGEKQDTVKATLTVATSLTLPTPFMGWISWNVVEDKISSNIIKEVANAFNKHQLKNNLKVWTIKKKHLPLHTQFRDCYFQNNPLYQTGCSAAR